MKNFEKCTILKEIPTHATGSTTVNCPIEPVVNCDLDEIALAIYDYIMCEDMTAQILKAKIVPCMKGHKSAGVSYVKCELQSLLKSKSN